VVVRPTIREIHPEAFPSDAILPQVEIATDAGQMLGIFRKYLRRCNGGEYDIRECVLTRIRHRPSARCILQYSLLLQHSKTGNERIQWASGVTYPSGRAEHIWKKLRAAGVTQQVSDSSQPFEPVSFVPELKMLVQLFPYDHRLPALAQLMNGNSQEVESGLLAEFGPGNWQINKCTVEPIRYRTGLAAVLRYTVQARQRMTGEKQYKRFYAKVYRNEDGEEIFGILKAVWDKSEAVGEHFTVGKPIVYLKNARVILQAEAVGASFQDILVNETDEQGISAARKIARALAALHLDDIPTSRRHTLQDELGVLESRARTLQWACPELSNSIESLLRELFATLKVVRPKPTHLDFKTDHVLVHGDGCALLDFDSFALADPVLDVAHALAQIIGLRFRFPVPHERLFRVVEAFKEEYFAHVPGEWRNRLPRLYAGALLKVAVGFFRRQERDWPVKVSTLMAEARASLDRRSE